MSYNGWSNYETWNAALWLSNDQGTEEACVDFAREACKGKDVTSEQDKDEAKAETARALESFVEEMVPDLGASMFADILGAALKEIDWYEIAEHYVDEEWEDYADAPSIGERAR